MRIVTFLVILLPAVLSHPALGAEQENSAPPSSSTPPPTTLDSAEAAPADTLSRSKSGWLFILPVLAYTPETQFMFGLTAGRYHRFDMDPDSRPSTLTPTFIYTANKQVIFFLPADLYWQRDVFHATGVLGYSYFPDMFYGIGNNTPESLEEEYTSKSVTLIGTLQKMIFKNIYFGGKYSFAYGDIVEREPGGLLDSGLVPGSDGGRAIGLGLMLDLDSRDDIYYPGSGVFLSTATTFYDNVLASEFNFTRYALDLRTYTSLSGPNILAFQATGVFTTGDTPFQMMPALNLRGYYEGRFRDKNLLVFQAEYRRIFWWRLGLALFGGVGQVAHSVNAFSPEEFKTAYGIGLRFQVGDEEKINIRLDFGIGEDGSSGTYIMFGEAF